MTGVIIVWSNAPDRERAESIAETLVREGLAACVHVLPAGHSHYVWEGRLQVDEEWTLMIKSRQEHATVLQARIAALHPYEVPEILVTPVSAGLPAYLEWLTTVTGA